ncbi:MAG: hypothetical protein IIC49_03900 [Planctomycetes bacterium]|nr:hypothetical protein [Planctomycetota bacterium]
MPNLASVLKAEIQRLARKEAKASLATTKQASAHHRRDIARLKREVADLARRLASLEKQLRKQTGRAVPKVLAAGARFSPKSVKSHRARIQVSAADYARLVGVSALTVYNWESGKTRPQQQQLAALVSIRGLGKREAWKRLDEMDE